MTMNPQRVLFVCLGNICRSPQAEGIFAQLVAQAGLSQWISCDSAGTSDYHIDELPDPRTRDVSLRNGLTLQHRSRQVQAADLDDFDWVIAMDQSNLAALQRLAGGQRRRLSRIHLLRSFDPQSPDLDVPDPWAGGAGGFDRVYAICLHGCLGLLPQVAARVRAAPKPT